MTLHHTCSYNIYKEVTDLMTIFPALHFHPLGDRAGVLSKSPPTSQHLAHLSRKLSSSLRGLELDMCIVIFVTVLVPRQLHLGAGSLGELEPAMPLPSAVQTGSLSALRAPRPPPGQACAALGGRCELTQGPSAPPMPAQLHGSKFL